MGRRDWYCEEVLPGRMEVERVYEDDYVLAFHHPDPMSKIHVVVIPKDHVPSLLDAKALHADLLLAMIKAVQHVAALLGLEGSGFYVRANAGGEVLLRTCTGTSGDRDLSRRVLIERSGT